MLTSTTLDVWISDNYLTDVQLLDLAEGGIEEARERLRRSSPLPLSSALTSRWLTGRMPLLSFPAWRRPNGVHDLAQYGADPEVARTIMKPSLMKSGFPRSARGAYAARAIPAADPRLRTSAGIRAPAGGIIANATETYGRHSRTWATFGIQTTIAWWW